MAAIGTATVSSSLSNLDRYIATTKPIPPEEQLHSAYPGLVLCLKHE
jgi:hypothetical protein